MKIGTKNYEEPNDCPYCHVVNQPIYRSNFITTDLEGKNQMLMVWHCSNKKCGRPFIVLFDDSGTIIRFLGGLPAGPKWPEPILKLLSGKKEDISKSLPTRFIKTYQQSLVAEEEGLDEIAGMGFRKAIEYLVKDWAIVGKPGDKEKIVKLWLGEVIKKYYSGDLKDILDRATWLGNDQTHYLRLFDQYDLKDLKELIALIVVEIDRQHKMNHFISTIQKKNSPQSNKT